MARDSPGTRSPPFASIGLSSRRRLFPTYLQAHTLSTSSVQRLGWLVYRLSATNRRCLQVGYNSTGGEEFEEMLAGFVTSRGDDCRHRNFRWKHGGDDLDASLFHKQQISKVAETDATIPES